MPCSKLWRFAAMGKQGRLCLSKSFGIRLNTGLNASTERIVSAIQEEDAVPNQNGYFGIPRRLGKLRTRNQLRLLYREGRFRRNPSFYGGTHAGLSRDGLGRRSRFRRKCRFGGLRRGSSWRANRFGEMQAREVRSSAFFGTTKERAKRCTTRSKLRLASQDL